MKVKVKVPFVFTDEVDGDCLRMFDNMPRPMQAQVIESLHKKREQMAAQVDFTSHIIDVLCEE